jgi:hypothetical protein
MNEFTEPVELGHDPKPKPKPKGRKPRAPQPEVLKVEPANKPTPLEALSSAPTPPRIKSREEVRQDQRAAIEAERIKDRKPVRGIFRFYDVPNGNLTFFFCKYPGDPVEKYDLWDGRIYTLPLGVARHLAKGNCYPTHRHAQDADGRTILGEPKMNKRTNFESLDFHFDEVDSPVSGLVSAPTFTGLIL